MPAKIQDIMCVGLSSSSSYVMSAISYQVKIKLALKTVIDKIQNTK